MLASGVFITRCEKHPKVLFFELLYRKTVRLPSEGAIFDLHERFFKPLQRLCTPNNLRWWLDREALQLIAASLDANHFAIVDGLLAQEDVNSLNTIAKWFYKEGQMRPGIEEQKGGYGGYWGNGNEGDFLNTEGLPRKWTMEGDFRSWVNDNDGRAPGLRLLTQAIDSLVIALKDLEASGCRLSQKVSERMRTIDCRENTMIACYPGETRGRYLRHCDTGRGAVVTCIFYLNTVWSDRDGGELRLYGEGFHNTQVKFDILPVANRLLLFWATEECPHEVMPTSHDRFAMTIWYRDSHSLDGLDASPCCTPLEPL